MASPFVSYAKNREDVVLARALRGVGNGRYVDVGANDPVRDSVTYAFYEQGWSGVTVEPVPAAAVRLRDARPRDLVFEAAVTTDDAKTVTLHHIPGTGLSTVVDEVRDVHRDAGWEVEEVDVEARRLDDVLDEAGWADLDIQLMVIDVEGAERRVLETLDLRRWRPWVLVVKANEPLTTRPSHERWEDLVLGGGYELCLYDGLSRFYVASERAEELAPALRVPANPLDDYVSHATQEAERERDEVIEEMRRHDEEQQALILSWRAAALRAWTGSAVAGQEQDLRHQIAQKDNHIRHVDAELAAMRRTLSWRITEPLRTFRSRGSRR